MTDRLHAGPAALEGIADQLGRAGDTLGAVVSGSPETPPAGAGTPIFDELLDRLARDAGGPAGGLTEAAAQMLATRPG